jgi:carbon-monoxide dehydrogenase large subunit
MYGGSATQKAAVELRQKLLRVAGKMLETDPEDLDARNGRIFVKGAPGSSVSFDEVVNQIYRFPFREFAEDEEPGLESTRYFRMGNVYHQPEKQGRFSNYPAWPNGTAACVVEVDEETGHVKLLRYCLVDDTGRLINPMLVDANLHGGITQGIGGAMYESIAYGDDGQLHTATLMDYTIPTAVEVPMFEVGHQETPSPFTPLGMKGAGESGVGSALGALCGAIENAFPELDLELDELILTPNRVWEAIQAARRRQRTGAGAAP